MTMRILRPAMLVLMTSAAPALADEAGFPVSIPHAFGTTTITEKPLRVATVASGNHEVPLALGVVPVGMAAANYGDDDGDGVLPWVEEKLAELGADTPALFDEGDGIDFEAVAAVDPDVILAAYSGLTQSDYDTLSQIAPVVAYPDSPWTTDWRRMIQMNSAGMGMGAEPQKLVLPQAEPWLPADRLHREFAAVGFYLSAHPLDEYRQVLEKMRVQNWTDFQAAVKRGATAGRLAGTVTSKQERKTRTGNKMGVVNFSDRSGQFEAVLFSETLAQYRDMLEPGRSVVITVSAEDRPEGVNLRIQTVQDLEHEASRIQKSLRIYLRDPGPVGAVSAQLGMRGEGQVSFIVIKGDGQGEIEVALPDRYRITPQVASAMKAVPGVVEVELV